MRFCHIHFIHHTSHPETPCFRGRNVHFMVNYLPTAVEHWFSPQPQEFYKLLLRKKNQRNAEWCNPTWNLRRAIMPIVIVSPLNGNETVSINRSCRTFHIDRSNVLVLPSLYERWNILSISRAPTEMRNSSSCKENKFCLPGQGAAVDKASHHQRGVHSEHLPYPAQPCGVHEELVARHSCCRNGSKRMATLFMDPQRGASNREPILPSGRRQDCFRQYTASGDCFHSITMWTDWTSSLSEILWWSLTTVYVFLLPSAQSFLRRYPLTIALSFVI